MSRTCRHISKSAQVRWRPLVRSGGVRSVRGTGNRGPLGERRHGQAAHSLDGLRARGYRWPPLRLVRLGCEPESVCVVLARLSPAAVHRPVRRSPAFIGLDVHRRSRSTRTAPSAQPGGWPVRLSSYSCSRKACAVMTTSRWRRRARVEHRPDPRAAHRRGAGCRHAQRPCDDAREGQERSRRRADAGQAVGRGHAATDLGM